MGGWNASSLWTGPKEKTIKIPLLFTKSLPMLKLLLTLLKYNYHTSGVA